MDGEREGREIFGDGERGEMEGEQVEGEEVMENGKGGEGKICLLLILG